MGCGMPVKEGSKPYSGLMIIMFITVNSSYSGIGCDAIDIITGLSWLRNCRRRLNNCSMVACQILRIIFHGIRGYNNDERAGHVV